MTQMNSHIDSAKWVLSADSAVFRCAYVLSVQMLHNSPGVWHTCTGTVPKLEKMHVIKYFPMFEMILIPYQSY